MSDVAHVRATLSVGGVKRKLIDGSLEDYLPLLARDLTPSTPDATYTPELRLSRGRAMFGFKGLVVLEVVIRFPRCAQRGEFFRVKASGSRASGEFSFDGPWSQFLALERLLAVVDGFVSDCLDKQVRSMRAET